MEALSKLEPHFKSAVNYGYKHNTTRAENELVAKIYNDAGGSLNSNWTCGYCVMQAYKTVGKWYFESKKEKEKEQAKLIQWETQEKQDLSSQPKKEEQGTTDGRAKKTQKD